MNLEIYLDKTRRLSKQTKLFNNEYIISAILLSVLLMIFFYNVIFFGATLMTSAITPGTMPTGPYGYPPIGIPAIVIDPGASSWQYEPSFPLASNIYKSGEIPLWDPYVALGTPFAADMQSGVFFPLNFIVYFMPKIYFWDALDLILLLRLFIAGFFTYCFMRTIEVNRYGSFASAVAFMFNGYFILFINMSHLNVETLIPILLFSFEKLIRVQDIKYIIFVGIVVALSILGGMPESTFFALFLAVLYYIYRIYFQLKEEKFFTIKKYALSLLSVFLIGGMLSALLTFPFIEFLNLSWNSHSQIIGLYHLQFPDGFISILVPYFYGWIHFSWNGLSQYFILYSIGILTAFSALSAFSETKKKTTSFFFAGFALFYLLKTYGFSLINWVGYLPLFNVSIFPKYSFPEFAFSLAVLAGIGIHNIHDKKINFKKSIVFSGIIVIIIAVFFAYYFDSLIINKNKWFFYFDPLTWVFVMLAFAFFIILIVNMLFFTQTRKVLNSQQLSLFLIFLLIFELFVYVPHIRPQRYDPFTLPPYIQFLKNDTESYRVVGMGNQPVLYPNTANAYEIYDIRNLNALYVNRYLSFIKRNIDPAIRDRFIGNKLNLNYKDGKFLNLLGVKYILSSSDLHYIQDNGLIDDILTKGEINTRLVGKMEFNNKTVLFEHPPARIDYLLSVPDDALNLNFSIGMDPAVWSPDKGDGVIFEIYINETGKEEKIFSKYVDPKNNPENRSWYFSDLNLSQYRKRKINMSFVTLPGPNGSNAYDSAGWGDILLKTSKSEEKLDIFNQRFDLVYDKEIKIYENNEVFPRTFVVHNAEVIKNEKEILEKLDSSDFDLRNSIIIEKNVPFDFKNEKVIDNSTSSITHYEFNSVKIKANLENDGFLVLSDTYYPGWKAFVDNKETEIYQADYFLRAVYVNKGTHNISFKYESVSFIAGLILSIITIFGIIGYFGLSYFRKK